MSFRRLSPVLDDCTVAVVAVVIREMFTAVRPDAGRSCSPTASRTAGWPWLLVYRSVKVLRGRYKTGEGAGAGGGGSTWTPRPTCSSAMRRGRRTVAPGIAEQRPAIERVAGLVEVGAGAGLRRRWHVVSTGSVDGVGRHDRRLQPGGSIVVGLLGLEVSDPGDEHVDPGVEAVLG